MCPSTADGDEDRAGNDGRMIAGPPSDAGRDEGIPADDDLAAFDMADDAFARDLRHVGRNGQREAPRLRGGDDGLRHGVLRRLVERGGKAQDIVLGHAVVAVDRDDLRAPVRQRAGLVEDQRVGCAPSSRAAPRP
jgi:hypothetical protein